MATIAEIRQKYPNYSDMSDQQLADAMHSKYYSDVPKEEFYSKIGFKPQPSFLQNVFGSTPIPPEEKAQQEQAAKQAEANPQEGLKAGYKRIKQSVAPIHPELGSNEPQRLEGAGTDAIPGLAESMLGGAGVYSAGKLLGPIASKVTGGLTDKLANSTLAQAGLAFGAKKASKAIGLPEEVGDFFGDIALARILKKYDPITLGGAKAAVRATRSAPPPASVAPVAGTSGANSAVRNAAQEAASALKGNSSVTTPGVRPVTPTPQPTPASVPPKPVTSSSTPQLTPEPPTTNNPMHFWEHQPLPESTPPQQQMIQAVKTPPKTASSVPNSIEEYEAQMSKPTGNPLLDKFRQYMVMHVKNIDSQMADDTSKAIQFLKNRKSTN